MTRTPGSKKAETHAGIVKTAARALRRSGAAGVAVADVMQQAGLTHGGFYAHFASRDAMLAEAAEQAAGESLASLTRAVERRPHPQTPLQALVQAYLSERHLQTPDRGCLLAAMGTDLQRASPALRQVATAQIRQMLETVRTQLPPGDRAERDAVAVMTLSAMVGAMVIARAVDDDAFAAQVLADTRERLAANAAPP